MSNLIHYGKAPITEAIIDLRVKARAEVRLEALHQIAQTLKQDYPQLESIYEATGKLHVKPGVSAAATAHQEQTGLRIQSQNGQHICQLQTRGLACSWLSPYATWEAFRDRAKSAWEKYRQAIDPEGITRLAVRYVNRIDIPQTNVELKDYFRTSPEISSDLPQNMAGFFMQVQLPLDDIRSTVVLNQTIVPPPNSGIISVILDLDIFRTFDVPQREEEVWEYFETLHIRKNEIFEACITDRTRELFK
jgi:uncharacterized protein (TIGR04255 family)